MRRGLASVHTATEYGSPQGMLTHTWAVSRASVSPTYPESPGRTGYNDKCTSCKRRLEGALEHVQVYPNITSTDPPQGSMDASVTRDASAVMINIGNGDVCLDSYI